MLMGNSFSSGIFGGARRLSADNESETVNLDDGLCKLPRSFLRQVVPYAALDDPVRVLARECLGVGAGVRVRRAVRVPLKSDSRHGYHGKCGQSSFKLVILRLAFGKTEPPAVIGDDNGDVVGVVEGRRAALERRVVEAPFGRSELPDELVKVTAVFFVARAAALRREIELVPPFEFGLRGQRRLFGFTAACQITAHRDERLTAFGPERRDDVARPRAPVEPADDSPPDPARIPQRPTAGPPG